MDWRYQQGLLATWTQLFGILEFRRNRAAKTEAFLSSRTALTVPVAHRRITRACFQQHCRSFFPPQRLRWRLSRLTRANHRYRLLAAAAKPLPLSLGDVPLSGVLLLLRVGAAVIAQAAINSGSSVTAMMMAVGSVIVVSSSMNDY